MKKVMTKYEKFLKEKEYYNKLANEHKKDKSLAEHYKLYENAYMAVENIGQAEFLSFIEMCGLKYMSLGSKPILAVKLVKEKPVYTLKGQGKDRIPYIVFTLPEYKDMRLPIGKRIADIQIDTNKSSYGAAVGERLTEFWTTVSQAEYKNICNQRFSDYQNNNMKSWREYIVPEMESANE